MPMVTMPAGARPEGQNDTAGEQCTGRREGGQLREAQECHGLSLQGKVESTRPYNASPARSPTWLHCSQVKPSTGGAQSRPKP